MIRFRALGTADLRGDDTTELRAILTQPRPLALLTYLALARPRGYQRRDTLLALLWPELGDEPARNALRQTVHRLRKALGDGVVDSRGTGELGLNAGRISADVVDFEEALDAGNLAAALDAYRGDLLPGFHVADAGEFARWLDGERDRLKRRAVTSAWALADGAVRDRHAADAAHWARRAADLTPDDEASVQRLIRLLVATGDRASAVRAYETFARRLAQDDGDEPSPETSALVAALRPPAAHVPLAPTEQAVTPRHGVPTAPPEDTPYEGPRNGPAEGPRNVAADPPMQPRRWTSVAVVAVAVAAMMIAALGVKRIAGNRTPPAPRTLAVLPFTVRGSADLAYLGEGMVDLLSAKLDGAAGFRTLDPRSVIAAAGDPRGTTADPMPVRVARQLGATWYVRGDVVEIAGRLQISAELFQQGAAAGTGTTATVSGDADSLFTLVDELTGRMLADQATGRDSALTHLAALTTRSLPALKAFLRGEQLMRAGLDAQSAAAFNDAIALDTSFALAQYRYSVAATWATLPGVNATVWASRAAQHSERLTPVARSLLTAYLAYRSINPDSAESLYRAATAAHPDYVEAWIMLGETYFHFNSFRGRSPMEAWPAFERVLALDPANPHALIHLARLAALSGRVEALDSIATLYHSAHHDAERSIEMRALVAYVRHDHAEVAAVVQDAPASGDYTIVSVLNAGLAYAQDADAARDLAPTFARVKEPVSIIVGRRLYADLPLDGARWLHHQPESPVRTDGDWAIETRALQVAEPFFAFAPADIGRLRDSIAARPYVARNSTGAVTPGLGGPVRDYLIALLSVRLGDTATATSCLNRLRSAGSGGAAAAPLTASLAHAVTAALARAAGDLPRALAELDAFRFSEWPAFPHWGIHERFLRAEVLHALGRDTEALSVYESFASVYDVPWMAPAHFRAGEIYAERGDRAQAEFHYTRFIGLWKDGDPQVRPLLARAEAARSRLQ